MQDDRKIISNVSYYRAAGAAPSLSVVAWIVRQFCLTVLRAATTEAEAIPGRLHRPSPIAKDNGVSRQIDHQ